MPKKIIIIGGGVAGLSAGIYARKNGYEAEIIEMHSIPGGQCTSWKRKGYTFDYCIHWLVGSAHGTFHDIWMETGALDDSVRIIDHEVYAAFMHEDGSLNLVYNDLDRWISYLISLAPDDKSALLKMKRDMASMTTLDMFDDAPGSRNIMSYVRMLKSWPAFVCFMKYGKLSASQYIERLNFKNQKLKNFLLDGFGIEDFAALAFLMMLSWFGQKNSGYPIGGSLPFSLRMATKFKELGGILTLKSKVDEIVVENGRATGITLEDGTFKPADYVIGAADLHHLMKHLLRDKFRIPEIEAAFNQWPLFTPIAFVSIGLCKRFEMPYHTYSFRCPGKKFGSTVLKAGYMLRNFNFDPVITPEGKTILTLMFESPWELWSNLEGESYDNEKRSIESDIRKELELQFPGISAYIEVLDVATPRTTVHYTGVWKGAYEGFKPTAGNITKSLKMKVPGVSNLYLAGQWLFPGGGLPPAGLSGKWVIQMITKADRKR